MFFDHHEKVILTAKLHAPTLAMRNNVIYQMLLVLQSLRFNVFGSDLHQFPVHAGHTLGLHVPTISINGGSTQFKTT